MTKVTIHAAKTNLSKLIAKVEAGEEVVICRGHKEVARLGPLGQRPKIDDAFYDPWSAKDVGPGVVDDEPEWGGPGGWNGRTARPFGLLKDVIKLDETFFDPLSEEDTGFSEDRPPAKRKR